MKSILYATDLTEQSVSILHYAQELSIKTGSELIVVYVHQLPHIRVSVTRPVEQLEQHAIDEQKDILKAFCSKHLGNDLSDKKIRIEVVCNDSILNGIIEKSKEVSPDLVLIGRKDKHTDRGLFAGDIGQGLVKRLKCPVLIAPHDLNNMTIKTILYATDFEEADITAIKNLAQMARKLDAKIHVVHIATEKQYAGKDQMEWFKEMLKQRVDYGNLEFKVIFSDHIDKELETYSQLINANVLALLYREEKGFFQHLFNKSLMKKLDSHTRIPLMSFNKVI